MNCTRQLLKELAHIGARTRSSRLRSGSPGDRTLSSSLSASGSYSRAVEVDDPTVTPHSLAPSIPEQVYSHEVDEPSYASAAVMSSFFGPPGTGKATSQRAGPELAFRPPSYFQDDLTRPLEAAVSALSDRPRDFDPPRRQDSDDGMSSSQRSPHSRNGAVSSLRQRLDVAPTQQAVEYIAPMSAPHAPIGRSQHDDLAPEVEQRIAYDSSMSYLQVREQPPWES